MVPVPMGHGTETGKPARFSGRGFTSGEVALIHEVVDSCSGLSRKELAQTLCELLGWKRPSGGLKGRECREFLERLESAGALALPAKQPGRPVGSRIPGSSDTPHSAGEAPRDRGPDCGHLRDGSLRTPSFSRSR